MCSRVLSVPFPNSITSQVSYLMTLLVVVLNEFLVPVVGGGVGERRLLVRVNVPVA